MSEHLAVFPGTFDPVTFGHLDIIRRGAIIFDQLMIGVAQDPGKTSPLFSAEERVESIRELVGDLQNVEVQSYAGMTVDFVHAVGANVILRGIRTFSDFQYEFQLALANRAFGKVETIFVMASEENAFVSSTLIKEAAALGADLSRFVPKTIEQRLHERLPEINGSTAGLHGDEAEH